MRPNRFSTGLLAVAVIEIIVWSAFSTVPHHADALAPVVCAGLAAPLAIIASAFVERHRR